MDLSCYIKLEKILIQSDERKRKILTEKWKTILQN